MAGILHLFAWKIPVILKIESLNVPAGYETVYPVKVRRSDVYWPHTKGEKVIKCDMGYEETEKYIEAHNSADKLEHISIVPYGGMSDIALYDSGLDRYFEKQPDKDNYITISYLEIHSQVIRGFPSGCVRRRMRDRLQSGKEQ